MFVRVCTLLLLTATGVRSPDLSGFLAVAPMGFLKTLDALKCTSTMALVFVVLITLFVVLYASEIETMDYLGSWGWCLIGDALGRCNQLVNPGGGESTTPSNHNEVDGSIGGGGGGGDGRRRPVGGRGVWAIAASRTTAAMSFLCRLLQ